MTAKISASADGLYGSLVVGANDVLRFGGDSSGQLAGFRNKLINGRFDFWQRGTGNFSATGYTADRWYFTITSGTGSIQSQSAQGGGLGDVTDATYYASISCTAGVVQLSQAIENVSTLSGKTVTLSYSHNNVADTGAVPQLAQYFGSGGSPSTSVFVNPVSDVSVPEGAWVRRILTYDLPSIVGKTLGTNNDSSLNVNIKFGGTFAGKAVWNIQLEQGSIATPFENRPVGLELILCQRYYEKSYSLSVTPGTVSTSGTWDLVSGTSGSGNTVQTVMLRVAKRVPPTITTYDMDAVSGKVTHFNNAGVTASLTPTVDWISETSFRVYAAAASPQPYAINRQQFHWTASAEL